MATALARGEAAKVEWVDAEDVVPARTLAATWGLAPQALGPAADGSEVFAVVIKRQRFFPDCPPDHDLRSAFEAQRTAARERGRRQIPAAAVCRCPNLKDGSWS